MLITATFSSLSPKCHISAFLRRLKIYMCVYVKAQNHNVNHFPTNICETGFFLIFFFPFWVVWMFVSVCSAILFSISSFEKMETSAKQEGSASFDRFVLNFIGKILFYYIFIYFFPFCTWILFFSCSFILGWRSICLLVFPLIFTITVKV